MKKISAWSACQSLQNIQKLKAEESSKAEFYLTANDLDERTVG